MKILIAGLIFINAFASIDFAQFKSGQKQYFIENKWDQFFGQASFYRRNLLPTNPQLVDKGLLTLEVLGLAKHCQWSATDNLLTSLELDYKDLGWSELRGKVDLLKKFNQVGKATKLPTKKPAMKEGKSLFRASADEVAKVNMPANLRVEVENKCDI